MNNKALLWVFSHDRQVSKTGPDRHISRFSYINIISCSRIGKVDGTVLGYVGDDNIYNPNRGNKLIGDIG